MPFYEYECSACKFYVEALQKISDPPMKKCPSCKKQTLKRLLSAPVFRLKGGGWYETDFKSDKENKRNLVGEEKEAAAATKTDIKEADKPESKPAETKPEKTETKTPADAKKRRLKAETKPPVKKK